MKPARSCRQDAGGATRSRADDDRRDERDARSAELRYAGSACRSITLLVTVSGRSARDLLPEGFSVFCEASEKALLSVAVTAYDDLSFDAGTLIGAIVSEVALRIEPPDDSEGSHWFLLSQTTNGGRLARRLGAVGLCCDVVDQLAFDDRDLGNREGRLLAVGAPWVTSRFSIAARTAEPLPARGSTVSNLWCAGARGLVRVTSAWHLSVAALAFGEVLAAPGGDLARVTGGEVVPGAGHYARFSVDGTITAIGRRPRP